MMLKVTQRLVNPTDIADSAIDAILALTADERTRSRHCFETSDGQAIYVQLPRGTVLQDGDVLQTEMGDRAVRIVAKPEPVMTVTADHPLNLLRAAYHLGNRHVALEVTETYLRLQPDPVLRSMLEHLTVQVIDEVQPFNPEHGAYRHAHPPSSPSSARHSHPHPHSHAHTHSSSHSHGH
ncbi:urease accessory protein UreE [Leptolyngbya sp. AN02str]|uniref:urease accessory protein UreE n=1 Tax=Leptolyngbya sp. AN02str TaxID=3423363 RepID=UPI003D31A38D